MSHQMIMSSSPHRTGTRGGSRCARTAPGRRLSAGLRSVPRALVAIVGALALLLAPLSSRASAQEPTTGSTESQVGVVSGRVVNEGTGEPIPDVLIRVDGLDLETLSDEGGMFRLLDVPSGERRLVLRHLAYGEHARWILVPEAESLTLEARLSTQAIELAPLLVETLSELDRRRITSGSQIKEVERPAIDLAQRTGRSLAEVLRQEIPGASMRAGWFGGFCVEYRGARAISGECRELSVFMDGVRIADPGLLLATLSPNDVERMEILSPAEAGARYGSLTGSSGVLLIETRRPPQPGGREDEAIGAGLTMFDWAEEERPYAWKRVFATSFVANLVGVGVSLALADQCLWRTEAGSLGLRTRCGGLATTGVSFLAMGLPSLGGSLAAQWGGATDRSVGRITPMSLTAALGVASGYMLVIHGTGASQTAGAVVLGLGVPVLTTLADRIFRSLR